jgi:GntR family transcriptional regulator, transcriptional repressor for pyruvate dehydrogenase complex
MSKAQGPIALESFSRARKRSLPAEVLDQLLNLIAVSSGAEFALPAERELCEQLGVSRNVLREALAGLESLGVVEIRGKSRIALISRARAQLMARIPLHSSERELLDDPLEVREILEPEVAALAAARASDISLSVLDRCLRVMEAGIERGERVVEFDSAFHVAIASATENQTLIALIESLSDVVHESRERSFLSGEPAAKESLRGHRAIVAAIRAHNCDEAREAMRDHLRSVERLIRETLNDSPVAEA